jgi:F-type H+-transporting ATPase subunit b
MEIDWITVSAQIVNFLILVWLLKRFLYQPVIRAMDRREQGIAERLQQAAARERQAGERAAQYREQSATLEHKRDALIEQARQQAERERQALLEEARAAAEEARRRWLQQTEQEKTAFLSSLQQHTVEAVQLIARKALADLADAQLEAQMVRVFIARLATLGDDARAALVGDATAPLRIRSSFTLEDSLRARLSRALHEQLSPDAPVQYEQTQELLCGIELRVAGQRLGWSLADYLDELHERVGAQLVPDVSGEH